MTELRGIRAYIGPLVCAALLVCTGPARALIIGSDTAVLAPGYIQFSGSDIDNAVVGFTRMRSGFALEDASSGIRWGAYFPVSGNIYLNGGQLTLDQDFVLNSDAKILGDGRVNAQGRSIMLGQDTALVGHLTFTNAATIDGQGHVLDFSSSGVRITASAGTTVVTLRNMTITGLQDGQLEVIHSNSSIRLQDCSVALSGDFSVTTGVFETRGRVSIDGPGAFRVAGGTLRIATNSMCALGAGSSLTYAGGAIELQDPSSRLRLQSADLAVEQDLGLTRGTLALDDDVTITVSSGKTLTYGNGTTADNLSVQHSPGARVRVNGQVVNANDL